ncbi:MAG: hypothetical protein RBQ71_04875 [Acholeplasmataceae bacterium]|jgi:ribosome-binding protein aMBF1 (putative translation factor)|nr:hypothetical protein [Acholeplasmataceae bacterium]
MKEKKKKEQSVETEVFTEDELASDEQPEAKGKKKNKKSKVAEISSEDEMIEVKQPKVKEKKTKEVKNRAKYTSKYFKKFAGRSHGSYDEMIAKDYQNVIQRAYELSSISEADYSKKIMITVPDAFDPGSKVNYRLDKLPDGSYTLLYDQALVTVLFFGDDSLYYHQANVDHRNGHIAFDVSGEFNYFDVVHIETALKYDRPMRPKYLTLDVELGLSDGTIIPFHLRNHRMHEEYDFDGTLTKHEQQFLDTLKQKIRNSRKL